MKRRDFLIGGMAGFAGLGGRAAHLQAGVTSSRGFGRRPAGAAGRADLVVRGGTIFDGTGASPRTGDVAISGDRITAVGQVTATGAVEVDARGMAVAPGFIDIHSHADLSLLVNPRAESRVRQGVTLEVVGQDGSSIGPWSDGAFEATRDRYRRNFDVEIDFRDIAGFLDRIDRERPAVSVASMVGHGTVRSYVIGGADRPATPAEIDRMRALVREALAGGAVGLSTGLEYTPGSFADRAELVAVAEELRGTGYPYASHMRNEDDRLLAALEEALHVGRVARVPVQVSHLKAQGERNYWKAEAALAAIEAARERRGRCPLRPLPLRCLRDGPLEPLPRLCACRRHGELPGTARRSGQRPGSGAGLPGQDRAAGVVGRGPDHPDRRRQYLRAGAAAR